MNNSARALIVLNGLRGWGYHGVLDAERATGQEFIVDIEIEVDIPTKDSIDNTVDYGELAIKVVRVIEGEPFNLIEILADAIIDTVLDDARIWFVRVTVHKPHAPITVDFDDVTVTISRRKHD